MQLICWDLHEALYDYYHTNDNDNLSEYQNHTTSIIGSGGCLNAFYINISQQ